MTIQEQMRKGTTTVILLKLLAEIERPMYGYEIIQELEARSQGYFQFKEGLIYPRLHELERRALLRAEWRGEEVLCDHRRRPPTPGKGIAGLALL
jgi:PadR family transcriptional regulator PadR